MADLGALSVRRVAVVAIGRPTFDLGLGARHAAAAWALLADLGAGAGLVVDDLVDGDPAVVTDLDEVDARLDRLDVEHAALVVVLQATFSDSTLLARVAGRTAAPIVVWSFPEPRTGGRLRLNALCGANLAAFTLRRLGHPARFVHVDPAGRDAAAAVTATLQRAVVEPPPPSAPPRAHVATPAHDQVAHASAVRLRGRRVGIVGDPPAGFEPCEGDADELRASTGIVVQRVPLADLFAAAGRVDSTTLARDERRVAGELDLDPDVATAGLDRSIALLGGLRELCDEHEWSALATRCWPECMADFGGAVCTPMAMLTEDGVPSVCEADLHGAVTALVLRHVSGGDPFVADLVDADVDDGTSVVWHCGVAATTLADPRRRPAGVLHPNRHVALVNQFALRPGRVTVARLSRAGGSLRLVVGGGEVLARPRPFQGTCGVLRWDRPVADVLATVFAHGLEHHLGIVYGDHRDALVALAAEWGMPVLHLGDDAGAGPGPV